MALIELGPGTPAPPVPATPPPAYVYRRAGLLVAVLLVLALGGAAPTSSLLWQRIALVPVADRAEFQLLDGHLYVVDFRGDQPRVGAWSTDPVRELWNVPGPPGSEDKPYYIAGGGDGLVMLTVGRTTTVLDAATGAVRWRSPTLLQRLDDRLGMVLEERFRPGTEYDQESGAPGGLYGASSDVLHTEPALSTSLSGVDLATGHRRWTATVPGSVSVVWTGPARRAIAVLSDARLTVRAPDTGAVLREREMPRVGGHGPTWFEDAGTALLVHYGPFGEGGLVAAYASDTLDELWQQELPDPQGASGTCRGLPCAETRAGAAVLDPRTGATLWRAGPSADLVAFDDDTVLELEPAGRPRRVLDRRTGRARIDLRYWTSLASAPGDENVVLATVGPATPGTAVGLLRPGAAAVQPLGRVAGGTDFHSGGDLVGCRVPGGVAIYRHLG
ncbi:hypothetical protein Asp14428_63830 [Actinoplanes sp. NBRC 14428]|uniref:Putative pyrroloquinoline-quinone binding quinoprotein n=1 Tax=Pseudosporangium ferrugineum TaxID=439699 RepID=A0A2T0RU44_9ACTN|nr:PQQ-binding-like beta-propeller repeat protein [Pseudosporangium ferrugineum]PRY24660.1 putative pyrroloquinoline-quinone binding quinoprotein [Pseudosporangium ferrugineum]BCJ54908.1 hypothetical protein Asp14428_63830 [Actinoplanes sp. NBRC 14428]